MLIRCKAENILNIMYEDKGKLTKYYYIQSYFGDDEMDLIGLMNLNSITYPKNKKFPFNEVFHYATSSTTISNIKPIFPDKKRYDYRPLCKNIKYFKNIDSLGLIFSKFKLVYNYKSDTFTDKPIASGISKKVIYRIEAEYGYNLKLFNELKNIYKKLKITANLLNNSLFNKLIIQNSHTFYDYEKAKKSFYFISTDNSFDFLRIFLPLYYINMRSYDNNFKISREKLENDINNYYFDLITRKG